MLKPRLLKSLIAQNAALLREQQGLMEYFRILEMSLHVIEKTGKDSGVVQLQELANIRKDMRRILIAHRNMIFNTTVLFDHRPRKNLGCWLILPKIHSTSLWRSKKIFKIFSIS